MKLSHIKCALITGATSDLAMRLAEGLAAHKTHLILTAKSKEMLLETADTLRKKTEVTVVVGDLLDPKTRTELIALMREHHPDLLVNNAGIGLYGPALMHSVDEQLTILDVNARALMQLTLEMAHQLKASRQPGVILNISSAASFFPFPTFSAYSASKAFVRFFSTALDEELKKEGIRVLCACPGQMETGFRVKAAKNFPQKPAKQALTASKAAKLLLKQIEKEKPLFIFDWRYRVAIEVCKWLFPSWLIHKILKKSIQGRFPKP